MSQRKLILKLMVRASFYLSFYAIIIFLCSPYDCYSKEVRKYHRTFKGLQVCTSTLNDAVKVLGSPTDTKVNTNNVLYKFYDDVHITIHEKTNKIDTIIIYNRKFKISGNRVGDSKESVLSKLSNYKSRDNTITDYDKGYIYWFKNGRVYRIVLACNLVLSR